MQSKQNSLVVTSPLKARAEVIKLLVGIPVFAVLLALSAHVRLPLPFTPVPVTLQVAVVLLAGGVLGVFGGAAAALLYLGMGAVGLPCFAGGVGLGVLSGATGGYLLAFPVASALTGFLALPKHGTWSRRLAPFCGLAVIYAGGFGWLMLALHFSAGKAFVLGVAPFLGVDALKAVCVAALLELKKS